VRRLLRWFFLKFFCPPEDKDAFSDYAQEKFSFLDGAKIYHNVFVNPDGRWVLGDMEKQCALITFETSKGDPNLPYILAFREGQRSWLGLIDRMVKAAEHPELYRGKERDGRTERVFAAPFEQSN
jgi:hypothetical protein